MLLRREVQDRLRSNHSPEQIARRLREDFPDDPEMWVSHETIYQSLFVQARGGLKRELTRHLRTGRAMRRPRRRSDQRRERFAGMVMISERPPRSPTGRCPAIGRAIWCATRRCVIERG
jgi:IS30 family transposase